MVKNGLVSTCVSGSFKPVLLDDFDWQPTKTIKKKKQKIFNAVWQFLNFIIDLLVLCSTSKIIPKDLVILNSAGELDRAYGRAVQF
jgi:hypothetical protein